MKQAVSNARKAFRVNTSEDGGMEESSIVNPMRSVVRPSPAHKKRIAAHPNAVKAAFAPSNAPPFNRPPVGFVSTAGHVMRADTVQIPIPSAFVHNLVMPMAFARKAFAVNSLPPVLPNACLRCPVSRLAAKKPLAPTVMPAKQASACPHKAEKKAIFVAMRGLVILLTAVLHAAHKKS
jgi:hypothetical protein